MRRLYFEEPVSSAALWARRVAVFAATVAALSVLFARTHFLDPPAALSVLGAAVAVALAALLLFGAACLNIWDTGNRGVGSAVLALTLVALTLAYPAYLAFEAIRLPVLADVSTDLADPPSFSLSSRASTARRGYSPRSVPDAERDRQRSAYPDVEPIVVDLDMDEAVALVLKTAAVRGWRLVDERPAGGRSGDAHLDFIAKTLVMGLDEDITVRLRPLPGQIRIDIRSASRHGRHDFGTNARRITAFAEELQSQLDTK
jgi:uncharacterized protein (DUF1499 family)